MSSPLQNNITNLQELLDKVNALPEEVTLPELTNEGVADDLVSGKQLIDSDGNVVAGTFSLDSELSTQDDLIAQIQTALQDKTSVTPVLQTKTVTPTTSVQNVAPDSGYDGLSKVTVSAIPSTYVKPTTTKAATTYTPTTSNQTIAAGTYCSGVQTIKGDANLKAENIAEGVSIFGITGTHSGGGSVETCNFYTGMKNSESTSILFSSYENGQVITYVIDTPNTANALISNSVIKNSPIILLNNVDFVDMVGLEHIYDSISSTRIYKITGDATASYYPCFVYGTLILLSDGTTKQVQDVTYEDSLLVWDFDNACYSSAKPLWIKKVQTSNYYYECEFENGIILKLVGSNGKCHRVFNVDDNIFKSATDCVGKNIMTATGVSKLIKCKRVDETVEFYNIITDYHLNLFANSVLTSCRLNNLYPIENMKFVKDNRQTIPKEKYGNIDDKFYYGLRLDERNCNDIDEINAYVERLYMLMEKEV